MPSSDPIEIYPNRFALLRLALVGTLFVVGGAWILWDTARPGPADVLIATTGGACVLFFGWGLVSALKMLFRNGPTLTITDEGMLDRASAVSIGFIPWSEIAEVAITHFGAQTFVSIKLIHPDVLFDRLGLLHRTWLRWNTRLVGYEISISPSLFALWPVTLADLIREHLPVRPVNPAPEPDPAEMTIVRRVAQAVRLGITLAAMAAACAFVAAARSPRWIYLMPIAAWGWVASVLIAVAANFAYCGRARRILLARRIFWTATLPSNLAAVCTFLMVRIIVGPRGHHSVDQSGKAWVELVLLAYAYLGLALTFGIFRRHRRIDPGG